jgi:hypothetical protein
MRFMMMVKHADQQGLPPKELMDAIAILAEEDVKAGTMIGSGGLAPVAQSTRIRISKGELTVTDGPFTEAKEVIGGFAQFELKSKEEAVKGAVRFMELHRKYWPGWEGETEIRQILGAREIRATCKGAFEYDGHVKARSTAPAFRLMRSKDAVTGSRPTYRYPSCRRHTLEKNLDCGTGFATAQRSCVQRSLDEECLDHCPRAKDASRPPNLLERPPDLVTDTDGVPISEAVTANENQLRIPY